MVQIFSSVWNQKSDIWAHNQETQKIGWTGQWYVPSHREKIHVWAKFVQQTFYYQVTNHASQNIPLIW